ncbi:MAG TPA: SDR family NAD(P)-dependent oxidoreductase [Acidimicrobiales bacterium]|nr:SDR family NAD(P)-dependent oxidoreductase [Acidimicrobiales bacterium]
MTATATDRRPVVAVTGGGGGIGAAIAEQLGREGWFVVTVDPLVSVDGSERLPAPEETTAGRIVAAGGAARASAISVTDRDAVHGLFRDLVDELGRLDAVINVAGISRPTSFAKGSEEDWLSVLTVHLGGYLNVLGAALPIMAAAGHGRILGVTSGSGWRQADTGAYGCAKRAVASLTWQLGRQAPAGVVVNAMSPIAMTRMVAAALGSARARGGGGSGSGASATGGLSLGSMPAPDQLGPFGAHLVSDGFTWCTGRVLFAGGSEVAVVEEPRLLEVVRADDVASPAHLLEAVTAGALAPAEANQSCSGGSNPRFGSIFDEPRDSGLPPAAVRSCAVVTDRPAVAAAVTAALEARAVTCSPVPVGGIAAGFAGAADALAAAAENAGPPDAVVVALAGGSGAGGAPSGWERVLAEHAALVDQIRDDAGWARAIADYAVTADRTVRLVTLTDAVTAGGRSRAQASAQLARAARRATGDRVAAFAVSVETSAPSGVGLSGELAAHLVCSPAALALSGAELAAGTGWFGLRSHPRPSGSVTFGGPDLPGWLDGALRNIVGAPCRQE